jgi:hypothetical protein
METVSPDAVYDGATCTSCSNTPIDPSNSLVPLFDRYEIWHRLFVNRQPSDYTHTLPSDADGTRGWRVDCSAITVAGGAAGADCSQAQDMTGIDDSVDGPNTNMGGFGTGAL